jgi:hypothetical protein
MEVFTPALFTPIPQTIFAFAAGLFVKLTLVFPFFAPATFFLFHTINKPVALLISVVFSYSLPDFLVALSFIFILALFTPRRQAIFAAAVFVKLALGLPLFTFAALLHLRHSLLVPHGHLPLLMSLVGGFI